MSEAPILIHRDGAVAQITLNRPDVLNAMSRALVAALTEAFRAMSSDESLRAIILTGAGRAFCCGLDLTEISRSPDAIAEFDWNGPDSLAEVMRSCPHPVICAVNGFAITGGLELALLGDFLIASQQAQFADTHARVGITPSWGLTQVLPRLIGLNRSRQMSLTGDFIDAQTAYDWGLANEVVPAEQLLDRAWYLASQIAETDRSTMGKIRALIGDSGEWMLSEALAQEARVFDAHIAQVSTTEVGAAKDRVMARGQAITRHGRGRRETR